MHVRTVMQFTAGPAEGGIAIRCDTRAGTDGVHAQASICDKGGAGKANHALSFRLNLLHASSRTQEHRHVTERIGSYNAPPPPRASGSGAIRGARPVVRPLRPVAPSERIDC